MISTSRSDWRLPWLALASGLGFWVLAACPGIAGDGEATSPTRDKVTKQKQNAQRSACGPLGYGPPGVYPGYQGFGLGYHLGYGYGGQALGVGANGGYPQYGGPGYPHPWPRLRRAGGITPFCYFGGPGYPTPECPNYFGGVGPLSPDHPVVTFEVDLTTPASVVGYGTFDGTLPYAESTFAPFATMYGEGGTSPNPAPAPPAPPVTPGPGASSGSSIRGGLLGTEEESMSSADGTRGLKISKVYVRSAAERAGLRAGDVILSINGYLTTKPSDLAWIIADASSNKSLTMNVRTASNGEVRSLTAQLP
jgi:PDZ domain